MELALEAIGDAQNQQMRGYTQMMDKLSGRRDTASLKPRRPWVAEVIDRYPCGKLKIVWLQGRKDYANANSIGSRGVMVWYTLHDGRVYWVNKLTSWSGSDRYYCRIANGIEIRMTDEEACAWVSAHLASTF